MREWNPAILIKSSEQVGRNLQWQLTTTTKMTTRLTEGDVEPFCLTRCRLGSMVPHCGKHFSEFSHLCIIDVDVRHNLTNMGNIDLGGVILFMH